MTYRRRLTLIVAVSVGVAIAIAAVVAYLAARSELRGQFDDSLRQQASLAGGPGADGAPPPGEPPQNPSNAPDASGSGGNAGGPAPPDGSGTGQSQLRIPPLPDQDVGRPVFVRVIDSSGNVQSRGSADLPTPSGSEIASITADGAQLSNFESNGADLRVITAPGPDGGVIQIARSLSSIDDLLSNLRTVLFLVTMAGIAISALIARAIANRMLAPVSRLSEAAEHVSATEDLSARIEVRGEDEVAQLGNRFNTMLGRLERSRRALDSAHSEQRQLIADASHELRTPVTALRTNIELLSRGEALGEHERGRVLDAASSQSEELGGLIGDLMDLARGEAPNETVEPVPLDDLVGEAVARARLHAPDVAFELDAQPCVVEAAPERIARALNNLLDNAAAHAGGGPVEVDVAELPASDDGVGEARVSVRDHGPGLSAGEETRVFDRFYRGRDGRVRPGSGLGLAIVKQVAESHGGSVGAGSAPDGGAVFELFLPSFKA